MSSNTDTLESMCELIVDCPHSTPKWTDSGVIVLRNQNIRKGRLDLSDSSYTDELHYQQRIKRAEPQAGDIIFTREAPMGEVCMIPQGVKCCLGQRQVLLRPKKDLNGKYLLFALQSPHVQHEISWNEGTGSTVSNVRIPVLKNLNIPRHPGHEDEIAEILSSLSEKTELNRQINQTLEHIAQAIFKSWFVDFEPVKAKIQAKQNGRARQDGERSGSQRKTPNVSSDATWPEAQAGAGAEGDPERAAMCAISGKTDAELDAFLEASTPEQRQQLTATAALFPDELEDSELGPIPKGWEIKPLPELINFLEGPGIRNWQYTEEEDGIKFINIRCIQNGDLKLDTASKITRDEAFGKYAHFQLDKDDIVVSTSGTLGRFAFVRDEHLPLSLNTSVIRFRPISGESTLHYIRGFVETQLQLELEIRASGSAQRNFGPMHLRQIRMLRPSQNVQQAHAALCESLYRMRQSNLKEIDQLIEIRSSLLPKLLSGEITIDYSDPKAEAVA